MITTTALLIMSFFGRFKVKNFTDFLNHIFHSKIFLTLTNNLDVILLK